MYQNVFNEFFIYVVDIFQILYPIFEWGIHEIVCFLKIGLWCSGQHFCFSLQRSGLNPTRAEKCHIANLCIKSALTQ